MGEIGCVTLTPDAQMLKDKQKRLLEEIKKSLEEYATTCDFMGHWYHEKGDKSGALTEFDQAKRARQCKANIGPNIQMS